MPRRRPIGSVPTCQECSSRIIWALTQQRKRQALDPRPNASGNVLAYCDGTGTWHARTITQTSDPPLPWERRYMPHAATCPAQGPPEDPPYDEEELTRW